VQPIKREMPSGKTGKTPLGRECLVSKKGVFERRGTLKVQPQRIANMQMMGDQAGQLGLARAQKSTFGRADDFLGPGIRNKAM
jgi:hypothetical protein